VRFFGGGEGGLHSRAVCDITAHAEHVWGHARSAVRHRDPVALFGEGVGDRQPDTPVAPSDKDGTAHLHSLRSRS